MKSREKGKRGERLWRDQLRKHGFDAKRTGHLQNQMGSQIPDVTCDSLPIHFEVKNTEKCQPRAFLAQACKDARKGSLPIIAHKASRQPWTAILRASDLLLLLEHVDVTALSEAIRLREAETTMEETPSPN